MGSPCIEFLVMHLQEVLLLCSIACTWNVGAVRLHSRVKPILCQIFGSDIRGNPLEPKEYHDFCEVFAGDGRFSETWPTLEDLLLFCGFLVIFMGGPTHVARHGPTHLGPAWAHPRGPTWARLGPTHVGPAWAHPLGPALGPPTWARLGPTHLGPAWAHPLGPLGWAGGPS